MIPWSLRVAAVAASLLYLFSVLSVLRSTRMSVKQSLLWLGSGALFLLLSLWPQLLMSAAEAVGFVVPSNAAFAGWLLVLTTLLFYQSLTTSRQSEQIKTLCQEIAILRLHQEPPAPSAE